MKTNFRKMQKGERYQNRPHYLTKTPREEQNILRKHLNSVKETLTNKAL